MDPIVAAGCVSIRELSRATSELIDRVERDEPAFVISRRGRMVALVTPLPDRLALEFDERASPTRARRPKPEPQVDLEALDLTSLASRFLIDAATTPTGFWWAPDSALWRTNERSSAPCESSMTRG